MKTPSGRLADLGLSAKKSLGQHFLHDPAVIDRICNVASIPANAVVVEVGPGLGHLTQALATRAAKVVAIEKDEELAAALAEAIPGNVEVLCVDALKFEPSTLPGEYYLVANLPYNVATAILRRFLDSENPPRSCTFMVQREVAERMVSRPPEMNILAVAMQFHGEPKIAFHIGRGAFVPPPRVTSSVVHMPVSKRFDIPQDRFSRFFELVRSGFSARRKQLKNSLSGSGLDSNLVQTMLAKADIEPTVRPQELDVADWVSLFDAWMALDPTIES